MDETRLEEEYFEYDPDEDISAERGNRIAGSIGNKIADDIFKGCRYNFHKLKKWIMMHRLSHLEKESFERNVSYKI